MTGEPVNSYRHHRGRCVHMASRTEHIAAEAERIVSDLVAREGMELVELVYRREPAGWVLRIVIDKEGGVTLQDCGAVSSLVGDVLDVKDIVPGRYNLEVSSPGLNRPLRRQRDFARCVGQTVRVRTTRAIDGRRNFKGRLAEAGPEAVVLEVDGVSHMVPLCLIDKANLEYDFGGGGGK